MRKIKKHRDHLIIRVGEVYTYGGRDYKVLTATSEIIDGHGHNINMTSLTFHLENIETGEIKFVSEGILKSELPLENEVIQLVNN